MTREHDEFERLGYCQRTLEEAVQQWWGSTARWQAMRISAAKVPDWLKEHCCACFTDKIGVFLGCYEVYGGHSIRVCRNHLGWKGAYNPMIPADLAKVGLVDYCQRTLDETVQQWEESVAVLDLSRCPFPALREDWEHILGGTTNE